MRAPRPRAERPQLADRDRARQRGEAAVGAGQDPVGLDIDGGLPDRLVATSIAPSSTSLSCSSPISDTDADARPQLGRQRDLELVLDRDQCHRILQKSESWR
jgi:hypothetical protein